jgi:nicotinate-nucleotide adenylyltransferase
VIYPGPMKHENSYRLFFGLSADPLHQKHVDLVVEATRKLISLGFGIGKSIIIPVYRRNPAGTKPKDPLTAPFAHRLAMCRLAAEEIGRRLDKHGVAVAVSSIERELAQGAETPNYTVETLQALQAKAGPEVKWILLLGSDLLSGDDPELGHWHRSDELVRLATIAVYPRPGHPGNPAFLGGLERGGARILRLDGVTMRDVKASRIRRRLQAGHDPLALSREGLLPEPVACYIKEHALYQTGS